MMVNRTTVDNQSQVEYLLVFVKFEPCLSLSVFLQCVSALVQPLGVCAEYLNSSLVQVSLHLLSITCIYFDLFQYTYNGILDGSQAYTFFQTCSNVKWQVVTLQTVDLCAVSTYCVAAPVALFIQKDQQTFMSFFLAHARSCHSQDDHICAEPGGKGP